MHEAMVAQSLLAAIAAEARKHAARPMSARLTCGKLYCINADVLNFAFDAIAKGTPCEGCKLSVEHKPLLAHCCDCERDFEINMDDPRCPRCNGDNFKLLPDEPLILQEIEFETE